MNTWIFLKKELQHYGVDLLNSKKCRIYDDNNNLKLQGNFKTIREINLKIKEHKKILLFLWESILKLLKDNGINDNFLYDEKLIDLFIFSLKDLSKFLYCFEELDDSKFVLGVEEALNRDINSFDKNQIYELPDYKISIDWIWNLINRLKYINKLLAFALTGEKNVSKCVIKTARGISGPWANLDLPMLERVFPFGQELEEISKDKQRQTRYTKGFDNYHTEGVGEGYYWREIKNEPFSWYDREDEDPYPHRNLLQN